MEVCKTLWHGNSGSCSEVSVECINFCVFYHSGCRKDRKVFEQVVTQNAGELQVINMRLA